MLLGPKGSYLETITGKKHRIFLKNGVYVLPVWMDTANNLFELSTHPFAGRGDAPGSPELRQLGPPRANRPTGPLGGRGTRPSC